MEKAPFVKTTRTDASTEAPFQHSRPFLKQQSEQTIDMALRYIEKGIVIVKTHAPIFSKSGRVGCTCEAYKRSDKYRQWCEEKGLPFDPHYTCPNPGKHPAGSWKHETVGVTLDKVVDTWGRFCTVTDVDTGERVQVVYNIGTLTGPSGLLTLDADTYKKHYQCDLSDFIDLDDQETPQAKSHRGGDHYLYDRQGKPYTNANGEMKAAGVEGVDIRGEGGFLVLAPSVGPSGNKYSWAEGLEPWNVELRPIPAALDAILSSAAGKRSKAKAAAVTFTTPTTERPDLAQWRMSKDILDLIHNPKPKGQRSEADYSVCLSLCYAGASDDDILSVFEHCPVGIDGKFAETGRAYLAHTIAQARAFVAEHPRQDVTADINRVRNWAIAADLSRNVADEHKAQRRLEDGTTRAEYRSGHNDKLTLFNVLDGMQIAGKTKDFLTSARRLSEGRNSDDVPGAPLTHKTVLSALKRLAFMFEVGEIVRGKPIAISLRPDFLARLTEVDCIRFPTYEQHPQNMLSVGNLTQTTLDYQRVKADDAFLTGTARPVKARMKRVARECGDIAGVTYPELMATVAPGLTTFAPAIVTTLIEAGGTGCTVDDLRAASGASLGQVRKILRGLRAVGLESHRQYKAPSIHFLPADAYDRIKHDLTPTLKTYGLGVNRLDKQLESRQRWAEIEAKKAKETGNKGNLLLAEKRVALAQERRMKLQPILHPERTAEQHQEQVYITPDSRLPWAAARVEAEERGLRKQEQAALIADLRRQGIHGADAFRYALYAGWSEQEAGRIAVGTGRGVG